MPEHAVCSPSAAHRWLSCPPSAQLEQQYPDTSSESAREGTFAHSWAELNLRHYLGTYSDEVYMEHRKELSADPFFSNALVEYVDEYVDTVIEKYNDAKTRDKGAALLLEQQVNFTDWVPDGFGRSDAIILADGVMEVIDLKYGRNIRVLAKDNPQLRLYALGAYNELSVLYDIDSTQLTIIQPRNGGESTELLPIRDLLNWGEAVKPIAKLAYAGKGIQKAGPHCKFCKAAPRCRVLAQYSMSIKQDKEPKELTDAELAEVLKRADEVTAWLNGVKEYALEEARDRGHKWPGFKLVEGRSCQKYTDETDVAGVLHREGLSDEDIYKPKAIIGITAMKKLLGPKKFTTILGGYLVKPPGKPTLAPESDKRPEWNSPDDDFEDISAM